MKIKKFQLNNWCNHQQRTIEFGDVTVIRGPNGSGKSNLISGLVFALSGVCRNASARNDNVRQGCASTDPCFVRLYFEHHSVPYVIERSIVPAKQSLRFNDTVITKSTEIDRHLESIFGIDPKTLAEFLFVPQWNVFSIVDGDVKSRASFLFRLFGIDRAEEIWENLQKIDLPFSRVDSTKLMKIAQFEEYSRTLLELEQSLKDLSDRLADVGKDCPTALETIERYQKAFYAEQTLKRLERSYQEATSKLQLLEESSRTLQAELLDLERDIQLAELERQDLESLKSQWDRYQSYQETSQKLQQEYRKLLTELRRIVANKPAIPAIRTWNFEIFENYWAFSWGFYPVSVGRFDPDFLGRAYPVSCPCFENCGNFEIFARVFGDFYPDLIGRVDPDFIGRVYPVSCAFFTSFELDLRAWKEWEACRDELEDQAGAVAAQLRSIPKVERPTRDLYVPAFNLNALRKRQEKTALEIAKILGLHESATVHVSHLLQQIQEVRDSSIATKPSEDEYSRAKFVLDEYNSLKADHSATLRRYNEIQERLQKLSSEVVEINKQLDTQKKAEEVFDHFSKVRKIFHRDNLPLAITNKLLNSLQQETNKILQDLEIPFRPFVLEKIEDLRFFVRFHDGQVCAAERLSGGQKVILAIAFRLAITLVFASKVGFLCFDEPTAGLDDDNVANLIAALGKIKDVSKAVGLQLVFVTHEKTMDCLSDRIIDLTPGFD